MPLQSTKQGSADIIFLKTLLLKGAGNNFLAIICLFYKTS